MNVIDDDLIVAARNETGHDAIMQRVLQRARTDNVAFNAGKIQFKVTTVTCIGTIVTKDGMHPDPDKNTSMMLRWTRYGRRPQLIRYWHSTMYASHRYPKLRKRFSRFASHALSFIRTYTATVLPFKPIIVLSIPS